MSDLFKDLLDFSTILDLFDPRTAVYILLVGIIFFFGKLAFSLLFPYNLNDELTTKDNKAVAVSFGGFLFGLGIILWGILGDHNDEIHRKNRLILQQDDGIKNNNLEVLSKDRQIAFTQERNRYRRVMIVALVVINLLLIGLFYYLISSSR